MYYYLFRLVSGANVIRDLEKKIRQFTTLDEAIVEAMRLNDDYPHESGIGIAIADGDGSIPYAGFVCERYVYLLDIEQTRQYRQRLECQLQ